MLRDITIGQYFPGTSIVHKLDPRIKIILTFIYLIILFMAENLIAISVGIVFVFFIYGVSKVPIKMVGKSLRPVLPIILFTSILNIFFVDGDIVLKLWIFKITEQGIYVAILMSVRVLCLIAGTSILTYTTSPIALTDAIERLMKPLNKIKVPVHELAMMMTIALRFIPTLIEETDKIMSAQKARGADMESGSIMNKAKSLIPILIPLFVSAFRRADELAMAMECRCYRGGEGRTRMRILKIMPKDIISLIFMIMLAGVVHGLNVYF